MHISEIQRDDILFTNLTSESRSWCIVKAVFTRSIVVDTYELTNGSLHRTHERHLFGQGDHFNELHPSIEQVYRRRKGAWCALPYIVHQLSIRTFSDNSARDAFMTENGFENIRKTP